MFIIFAFIFMQREEENKSKSFEEVIKMAVAPKPFKFTVTLDATNSVYPKQPKTFKEEIGINVRDYDLMVFRLKPFTGSSISVKINRKPIFKFNRLHVLAYGQNFIKETSVPEVFGYNLIQEPDRDQVIFGLTNPKISAQISFDIELTNSSIYKDKPPFPVSLF